MFVGSALEGMMLELLRRSEGLPEQEMPFLLFVVRRCGEIVQSTSSIPTGSKMGSYYAYCARFQYYIVCMKSTHRACSIIVIVLMSCSFFVIPLCEQRDGGFPKLGFCVRAITTTEQMYA